MPAKRPVLNVWRATLIRTSAVIIVGQFIGLVYHVLANVIERSLLRGEAALKAIDFFWTKTMHGWRRRVRNNIIYFACAHRSCSFFSFILEIDAIVVQSFMETNSFGEQVGDFFGTVAWLWVFHRFSQDGAVLLGYQHPWEHGDHGGHSSSHPKSKPAEEQVSASWEKFSLKSIIPGDDDDDVRTMNSSMEHF